MTRDGFYEQMKNALGIPLAYIQFTTPQKLPFAMWCMPSDDDLHADNSHYYKIGEGWLEVYSEEPDFNLQDKAERFFKSAGLPYGKENEAYIDTEDMFYCRWRFQLF